MKQDADGTTSKPRLLVAMLKRNGVTQHVYRPPNSDVGATESGCLIILSDEDMMRAEWAECGPVGDYLGTLRGKLERGWAVWQVAETLCDHVPAWTHRQANLFVRCLAGLEEEES
jgi:hypothetical protein